MDKHDIIVIGTSAGGVRALERLFEQLPEDLSAAVFVVLHVRPEGPSHLPEILQRQTKLPVAHARDGEPIEKGRVYIAPPNYHLVVELGHVHLTSGPRENRTRPAINPLFRSASLAYGPRVIGVVLTGIMDDGTLGIWDIKRRGGIAVVQDPADALYDQMPASAIENVSIDYCVPIASMGALLVSLTKRDVHYASAQPEVVMHGENTDFTCPECSGPLRHFQFGELHEFKCRVGHRYSPNTILMAHDEAEERVLWSAAEYLEEGADLLEQMLARESLEPSTTVQANIAAKRRLAKTIREAMDHAQKEVVGAISAGKVKA